MSKIFICYSRKNSEWKERLLNHLDVFSRHGLLDAWHDVKDVAAGDIWEAKLADAIRSCRMAVVLLCPDALDSKIVLEKEFPPLRERQLRENLRVIPVICKPCEWEQHEIASKPQVRPLSVGPHQVPVPLSQMSLADADRALRLLATEIAEQLSRLALNDFAAPPRPPSAAEVYLDKFPLTRGPGLREEKLIGREQELALLDLAFAQPHSAIVSLVAWGGVGKTMLVQHWLQRLQREGWFGARRVYAWSFYSQGTKEDRQASEDTFLADALKWFGVQCEPTLHPYEKGRLLADAVARERNLLILDGIEPLQHPPGPRGGFLREVSENESHLRAPGVQSLLKQLACKTERGENTGLCLVTTRVWLADLNQHKRSKENPHGTVLRVDLGNLMEDAGARLLHEAGATRVGAANIEKEKAQENDELLKASREVDGHALTLNLLGRFLLRAHGGDILRRDRVKFEEADRKEQGGTTFKMLAAFENWFANGGEFGARRLTVMRLLSLFDEPADSGCTAILRKPPAIVGLTDSLFQSTRPLADEDWNETISFLAEFGLIEVRPQMTRVIKGFSWQRSMTLTIGRGRAGPNVTLTGPPEILDALAKGASMLRNQPDKTLSWPPVGGGTAVALDTHPLIREYFALKLRRANRKAWEEAHERLYLFLKEEVPYWPDGLESSQLLVQAIWHGCRGKNNDDAFAELFERRLLRGEDSYITSQLGAFQTSLGALANFFERPWTVLHSPKSESAPERVLNNTAFSLGGVGRFREALQPMSLARKIAESSGNWKDAAISAANACQMRALIGDLAIAVTEGETGVDLANRSNDVKQRALNYGTLGHAIYLLGNWEKAANLLAEADQIVIDAGHKTLLGSLPGFRTCDLLGSRLERAAWCKTLTSKPINIPPLSMLTYIEGRARAAFGEEHHNESRLNVALDHLAVGRIEIYHSVLFAQEEDQVRELQSATKMLSVAIDEFRRYAAVEFLPFGLLSHAWLCSLGKKFDSAEADLDEAWDICDRSSMRLHLADVHLYRARLFFREKPYPWKSPQDDLAEAEKLIDSCGYHCRDAELADAKFVILGIKSDLFP